MPSPTRNVCTMTAPQRAAIDTNVVVALVDRRDHWHPNAQALREALQGGAADLVYLDPVLFDRDFDQVTWLTRVETPAAVMTAFKQATAD